MSEYKRFVLKFDQGQLNNFQIWVDIETGVNYVFARQGASAGLTVLVDENGNPVLSEVVYKK
ncbi:DUF6440 family protein [Macrococcus sp. EM39E]|uniref:DUF6440 family protein n=1 Tax=Macrococcus animalis TaxID=3395467 RepID=UPI0039BF33A0